MSGVVAQVMWRTVAAVPVLVLATFLSFVLLFQVGNPAAAVAGELASAERLAEITARLGLERGVLAQYLDWLGSAITGDLGLSWHNRGSTGALILQHTLPTVLVVGGALLASMIGSTIIGAVTALRPDSLLDRAMRTIATAGIAVPNFLLGLLLVLVFSVTLSWLPAAGYRSPEEGVLNAASYLVLPIAALALALLCQQMRTFRASILKEYHSDYVRTARMKRVPEGRIFTDHVVRNAAAPLVTVIGLEVGVLVTGSVLVESVFAIPGLGSLLVASVQTQDFPVVQALVATTAVAVLAANLVADLITRWLHPAAEIA